MDTRVASKSTINRSTDNHPRNYRRLDSMTSAFHPSLRCHVSMGIRDALPPTGRPVLVRPYPSSCNHAPQRGVLNQTASTTSTSTSASRTAPGPASGSGRRGDGGMAGSEQQNGQPIGRRAFLACVSFLTSSFSFSGGIEGVGNFGGDIGRGGGRRGLAHAEVSSTGVTSSATLTTITTSAETTTATATTTNVARAVDLTTLQEEAYLAYAERRFQDAVNLLTECITAEPGSPRWREMRAEVLVDGKNFPAAVHDFNAALGLLSDNDLVTRARLLSGRALAYEGLSDWEAALADYRRGMDLAAEAGESLDPYVLNSLGNCLNSLGRWEDAREQYLASAAVFQQARGFRGRNGSTTPRLDGAIFASSNAALMRAQMGDTDGAIQEMVRIARRAPGSADMRAALAALYWGQGRRQEAEEMWEFACDRITVGCAKYTDLDWLGRIRRWPPIMVDRMADFLALK
ncbi:hypothetical protein Vretimale_11063 [Volvox reticuliferus]|uniref:Tetratricopeptide repeat protein n=1 Tax=Volvox reticuliferus TaxID=1737510 RepID=A0A8J4CLL1_9CHLO|nr:hypothetical protein Vretifemale_12795 [Volvox reticuliferus]GIM06815.1 hypothetical protein Vretimale_11063 [Volvox reticuliferus]